MVHFDEKHLPKRTPHDVATTLVRKAHPALFAVIMATGIVSMLFAEFPFGMDSKGMTAMSLVFFINLVLLCTFAALFLAKHTLYPDRWAALMRCPVTSLYLGTFPMGACTLVNVSIEVIYDHLGFGGENFVYFLWSMWWIIVVISCLCCWAGVHAMATLQKHSLGTMAPSWLLPVTTLTVVSSCGGILANALRNYSPQHALITTVTSVFLVSVGLCLGMMVLTLYLARLIIYGLPSGGSILSVFLPLGTTGQSGFAFFLAGKSFKALLPYEDAGSSTFLTSGSTGDMLHVICMSAAFILWALATMWMLFALLALYTSLPKSRPSFAMSFWGLVFPNGVYANLTITLGKTFDSNGFRIYGSLYAVIVLCLWVCIAARSLWQLQVVVAPDRIHSKKHDTCMHHHRTHHRDASTLNDDYEGEDFPPWNYDYGDSDERLAPPSLRTSSEDTEVGLYTS